MTTDQIAAFLVLAAIPAALMALIPFLAYALDDGEEVEW